CQVDVDDVAVAADEHIRRDLGDGIGPSMILVARTVDQVGPGNIVFEQEPAYGQTPRIWRLAALLESIEVDAEDAQATVAVSGVDRFELRDFLGVGQAPTGPENDEHHIAVEIGQPDGSTV